MDWQRKRGTAPSRGQRAARVQTGSLRTGVDLVTNHARTGNIVRQESDSVKLPGLRRGECGKRKALPVLQAGQKVGSRGETSSIG